MTDPFEIQVRAHIAQANGYILNRSHEGLPNEFIEGPMPAPTRETNPKCPKCGQQGKRWNDIANVCSIHGIYGVEAVTPAPTREAKPTQDTRKEIGRLIRNLREDKGLTQKQLGEVLGHSHAAVSDIELGKTNLSVSDAAKLAPVLGVTLVELITSNSASAASNHTSPFTDDGGPDSAAPTDQTEGGEGELEAILNEAVLPKRREALESLIAKTYERGVDDTIRMYESGKYGAERVAAQRREAVEQFAEQLKIKAEIDYEGDGDIYGIRLETITRALTEGDTL